MGRIEEALRKAKVERDSSIGTTAQVESSNSLYCGSSGLLLPRSMTNGLVHIGSCGPSC
jgi:hypothetical protein